MAHVAIVKVSGAGRVEKFQSCDTQEAADAHVARVLPYFPLAYAVAQPAGGPRDWLCDAVAKTAVFSPLPQPTQAEIEAALVVECDRQLSTGGRMDRLNFEVNFDQENRIRTLAGQPSITRAQYLNALKNIYKVLP
jgi:hypothetical protein